MDVTAARVNTDDIIAIYLVAVSVIAIGVIGVNNCFHITAVDVTDADVMLLMWSL
jgi:hypothetical protein